MTSLLPYVSGFGLIALIAVLAWFLACYMTWAVENTASTGIRARLDGFVARLARVDPHADQGFRGYAVALLVFSLFLMVLSF
jgi:K+-transporting ATPase A subunit